MKQSDCDALAEAAAQEYFNDGGPAFPHLMSHCQVRNESEMHPGLSLRDYFAGQALPKAIENGGGTIDEAKRTLGLPDSEPYNHNIHWPMLVAKECYAYADALLAQREKGAQNV